MIVKSKLLLLSAAGVLLSSAPAEAARLLNWDFNSNSNQLSFSTDAGVQPSAQLISNPSRLIIDLPGTTLGSTTVRRQVGGAINNVRAGQYKNNVTRLVVELSPNHTIDPQQIKIQGRTANQWSVQLPAPSRVATPPVATRPSSPNVSSSAALSAFRVTRNGFFISLGNNQASQAQVRRINAQTIEFNLPGGTLPTALVGQTLEVNRYGVKQVKFSPANAGAKATFIVNPSSPNWTASLTSSGSLVVVPAGDMASARRLDTTPNATVKVVGAPVANQPQPTTPNPRPTTSTSVKIPVPPPLVATPSTFPVERPSNSNSGGQTPRGSIPVPPRPTVVPTPAPKPAPPPATRPAPRPNPAPTARVPNSRLSVTIDPGHGGRDPGAVGIRGLREKDVVIDISRQVASLLEQRGINVQMTRRDDRFISLQGRAQMANRAGSDLFVSIHANAISMSRPEVNGVETFYYPGSSRGRGLAQSIQSSMLQSTNMRSRGVRSARFYVIKHTSMPAALVEVGFVTGREDAPKLQNPAFRRQMAQAIADGIVNYLR